MGVGLRFNTPVGPVSLDFALKTYRKVYTEGYVKFVERAPDLWGMFFKKTDDSRVIEWYGKIMEWVQNQTQFTDAAKDEFASGADGWLVAYAKNNGLVVVTHEDRRPAANMDPYQVCAILVETVCGS